MSRCNVVSVWLVEHLCVQRERERERDSERERGRRKGFRVSGVTKGEVTFSRIDYCQIANLLLFL